jgi:hypothetical protein
MAIDKGIDPMAASAVLGIAAGMSNEFGLCCGGETTPFPKSYKR